MAIANITSSRAKLVRANEHFKALEEEVHEFGQDKDAKTGTITYGRDGAWHVLYLSPLPLLPMYLALLAGDCLTNVRAALDHLVWQLVLREGKKPEQANSFPICDTEDNFRGRCIAPAQKFKNHPLRGIPLKGDAWAIIERAQPFHHPKPEEHPLAVVNWLVNVDKHHALLVQKTFVARDLFSSQIHWKPGSHPIDQRFSTLPLSSEQPTEIVRFLFAPGVEPDLHSAMDMEKGLPLQPCVGDEGAHVNILRLDLAIRRVNQLLDEVATLPRVEETPLQSKVAKRGVV